MIGAPISSDETDPSRLACHLQIETSSLHASMPRDLWKRLLAHGIFAEAVCLITGGKEFSRRHRDDPPKTIWLKVFLNCPLSPLSPLYPQGYAFIVYLARLVAMRR